jgi:hypothetical protein
MQLYVLNTSTSNSTNCQYLYFQINTNCAAIKIFNNLSCRLVVLMNEKKKSGTWLRRYLNTHLTLLKKV